MTRILVDGRWLHRGGVGRATELALRGIFSGGVHPSVRCDVWGPPERLKGIVPRQRVVAARGRPERLFGQFSYVPRGYDVTLFMHQIRPLRPARAVTMIHDTIPLRTSGGAAALAKRTYLRLVAEGSLRVLTVSRHSKSCIERDLGVSPERIAVVDYPVDESSADRIVALRARFRATSGQPRVLYVGRYAPHKNVDRVVEGFVNSELVRDGGVLTLVGVRSEELQAAVPMERMKQLEFIGSCTQPELEALYARSSLLLCASSEEGFGLPVWEARACGLPVCSTEGGALSEILGSIPAFQMVDSAAVAAAIDVVARDPARYVDRPSGRTVEEFGGQIVRAMQESATL